MYTLFKHPTTQLDLSNEEAVQLAALLNIFRQRTAYILSQSAGLCQAKVSTSLSRYKLVEQCGQQLIHGNTLTVRTELTAELVMIINLTMGFVTATGSGGESWPQHQAALLNRVEQLKLRGNLSQKVGRPSDQEIRGAYRKGI